MALERYKSCLIVWYGRAAFPSKICTIGTFCFLDKLWLSHSRQYQYQHQHNRCTTVGYSIYTIYIYSMLCYWIGAFSHLHILHITYIHTHIHHQMSNHGIAYHNVNGASIGPMEYHHKQLSLTQEAGLSLSSLTVAFLVLWQKKEVSQNTTSGITLSEAL